MSNTTLDINPVIDGESVVKDATYNSKKVNIRGLVYYVQFKYSSAGAMDGTLKLQGSQDPATMGWQDVLNGSHDITVVGGVGGGAFNISNAAYPFMRIVVSPETADGTFTAVVNTKEWN